MARKIERMDAKRLYTEDLKEIPEIATQLHVPEATVYRWKAEEKEKGSDWDRDREEIRMTSVSAYKQALKIAVDQLRQIVASGEIDAKKVDGLLKVIKSAKSLFKDVDSLGNILLATQELIDFLQDRDPEALKMLQPLLSEFGQTMSKKYGRKRN